MTILDNMKKAVYVSTKGDNKKASKRISMLLEVMYDGDVNVILKESSSENIFVWLPEKKDDGSNSPSTLRSIEISDPASALALHLCTPHLYKRGSGMVVSDELSSIPGVLHFHWHEKL